MEKAFDLPLTEEQMAAYLDGMLDSEQSSMVEDLIGNDFDLQQIEDAVDAVDAAYLNLDPSDELPLECLADNFVLPEIALADDLYIDHNDDDHADHDDIDDHDIDDNYNHDDIDDAIDNHDIDDDTFDDFGF